MSDELTAPSAPLPEEPTAILRHMRTETFPKMIAFYTPVLEYIDSLLARLQEELAKNNYVFEQHDGTKASIADLCNYKKRMEQSESRAAALRKELEAVRRLVGQSREIENVLQKYLKTLPQVGYVAAAVDVLEGHIHQLDAALSKESPRE